MRNTVTSASVFIALLYLLPTAIAEETVGSKVVKFCKDKVGQTVGGGECAHLAVEALRAADAKLQSDFTDSPNKGDYVWGDLIYLHAKKAGAKDEYEGAVKDMKPGDIMQFRDAKFAGPAPNGGTYSRESPHHTAVVAEIKEAGKVIVVFEQNIAEVRKVMKTTYRLAHLREGWVRVYRPVAK